MSRADSPAEPTLFDLDELDAALRKMVLPGQPDTSRQAARRALATRSQTQLKVAHVLHSHGPISDLELHHQCCARFGCRAESSYRKRRSELTELGYVAHSGQTRVEQGARRVLWTLTEAGHALATGFHP